MSPRAGRDTVEIASSLSAVPSDDLPEHSATATAHSDWSSWLIRTATFFGFAIPAVAYLWMIHSGTVNIVFADQWDDVALIGHAQSGTLHFSTLWSQHYENRIFFPNLIVLVLAYTTHFNVVTEEYLSTLMLFGGTALVIWAHKRRSPDRRWIWYCPVAFLLLSLAQAVNALWGFQMAWYLVLLMVALALFLLDQEKQQWFVFGGAIAAAVIASFSSVQGLLVWPAGLLLILLRRRSQPLVTTWIGAAVAAGVIYFVGFDFNASPTSQHDPTTVVSFYIRVVGDIVGDPQPGVWVAVFGAMLTLAGIWVLARFAVWSRTSVGGRPFALSLLLFGLLFTALTAYGRSGFGSFGYHPENRYTVFAIFVLVGLYLAVLDPPAASELPSSIGATRHWHILSDRVLTVARVVAGLGVVVTVVVGTHNGISQERNIHQNNLYLGRVTVRAGQYPNTIIEGLDWLETPKTTRGRITIAKQNHLSLFGTGDAGRYLSEKPLNLYSSPLHAVVTLPVNGSAVHGRQLLDVGISDVFDVEKVIYVLNGQGRVGTTISTGVQSNYGWLGGWNTATVPNGSYTIDAKVSDSAGRKITTSPIRVRVQN